MNKLLATCLLSSFCFFAPSNATDGERFLQSEEAVTSASYGHIDAKGLKNLLDSGTPLTLLDARGNKWHDNNIIQGAKLASYEYSIEEIEAIVPEKDSLVVVYCFSFTCPLSPRLATKLVEYGYTHVIEYPAGLKEWRDMAGYPVDVIDTPTE